MSQILLGMRNVSDIVLEKIKARTSSSVIFFSEKHNVNEIMSKNMVQPDRPQMTI
jgi:hypothetical protein